MNRTVTPFYIILPVEHMYEQMNDMVESEGVYDFPFTMRDFVEFMSNIIGTVIPLYPYNTSMNATQLARTYLDIDVGDWLVQRFIEDMRVQLSYLNLPTYPAPGYVYKFYITGDYNMHIKYKPDVCKLPIFEPQTRDDILYCINNGDFISDKLKQQYGIT